MNGTSTKVAQSRNFGLDLLRVLACYMVIQVHAGEFFYIDQTSHVIMGTNTFWVGILNSLCRASVPLFVMLSGYFLLPLKESNTQTFYRKRFVRVVVPFVIWCALYAMYNVLRGNTTFCEGLLNICQIPVNYGVQLGHLWYIYMLIGLYLFAPIISPWLRSSSRKSVELYLYIWIFTLLIPYIHRIFPEVLGECYWNNTPMLYYFSGLLGYMILGAYLKLYWREWRRWFLPLGIVLVVAGYALTVGVFVDLIDRVSLVADLELSWNFDTINVAMMTLGLFLLFKNIGERCANQRSLFRRIITDISALSYGIYLAHMMLLNLFHGLFASVSDSALVQVPLMAICAFAASYAIIKLLSLLPQSKYLVG